MNHAKQTRPSTHDPSAATSAVYADSAPATSPRIEQLAARLQDGLPGHLGIELVAMPPGQMILKMAIQPLHTAANGYLHAGAVVTLADTACGFGCIANLPAQAHNFTTIELKSNFLSTALDGVIIAHATLRHAGRRTQIWDAEVRTTANVSAATTVDATVVATVDATAAQPAAPRMLALFRCTQMILYP